MTVMRDWPVVFPGVLSTGWEEVVAEVGQPGQNSGRVGTNRASPHGTTGSTADGTTDSSGRQR
jgi:hypothetical protein